MEFIIKYIIFSIVSFMFLGDFFYRMTKRSVLKCSIFFVVSGMIFLI